MTAHAVSASALEELVRALRDEVAQLRARLDAALGPEASPAAPRRSAASLAWAEKHGIDLDEFEPFEPPPAGTHTMTVREAARELGLGIEQVRRHLRSGQLRGTALGGRAGWRVSRADVVRFRQVREAVSAGR